MIKFLLFFALFAVTSAYLNLNLGLDLTAANLHFHMSFGALIVILSAATFTLYSYIDSIMKDISLNDRVNIKKNYNSVIDSFDLLKSEVLENIFAAIILFVISIIASGLLKIFKQDLYMVLASSIQSGCFFSTILITYFQLKGFMTASTYRKIISK